jgi:exopolyphosphatase/guanosine-5'-triphosphate,3'-diphosphate pyrophosphatase
MSVQGSPGKWLNKLTAASPAQDAARRGLRKRLRPVAKLLKRATRGGDPSLELVHELRVSTRRGGAVVRAFGEYLPRKQAREVLRALRKIRRAAGPVREIDVQLGVLAEQAEELGAEHPARLAIAHAAGELEAERDRACVRLARARRRVGARWLARACRELEDRASQPRTVEGVEPDTLADAARAGLAREGERLRAAANGELTTAHGLHELRLAGKRLRYTLELFGACLQEKDRSRIYAAAAQMQERLGAVSDAVSHARALRAMVERLGGEHADAVRTLAMEAEARAGAAVAAAQGESFPGRVLALLTDIEASLHAPAIGAGPKAPGSVAPVVHVNGTGVGADGRAAAGPAVARRGSGEPLRVAAIDVGTNSIRLIIAEAGADGGGEDGPHGHPHAVESAWAGWGGGYRVLDDEREVARLGRGLDASGKLDEGAMRSAATAIARMRGIAEGYGVQHLRVIGTAAVRDAANGSAFVDMVREIAGVALEVIDGEQEARLAYRSAASAFDLSGVNAAVCDIGGGSTEVVLSSSGVVEHVVSVPVGAVRLTERFGGPGAAAGERFEEMSEHVRELMRRRLEKPPLVPQVFVGTGGTFTALANMVVLADLGQPGDGLFSGHVQGHEIKSWQVKHVLENLRKMPLRERQHVPGLNPDRADIIVAGLVLVDALMRRLGVNRVLVHEGGIRDGLLRTMVARLMGGEESAGKLDPMRGVRRFARACGYEHRHCQHVTTLALSIFDQLAALPGAIDRSAAERLTARARLLLEAGALLHDVGYLINYDQHHKHGYHLIVHADLPGFSATEIEVIANLARYHRRSEPKRGHRTFDRLPKEERAVVEVLAGILRIADGLDRTHTQRVEGIELARGANAAGGSGREVEFILRSPVEPEVDIWGATRKAGLLRRVLGVEPTFRWIAGAGVGPGAVGGAGVTLARGPGAGAAAGFVDGASPVPSR